MEKYVPLLPDLEKIKKEYQKKKAKLEERLDNKPFHKRWEVSKKLDDLREKISKAKTDAEFDALAKEQDQLWLEYHKYRKEENWKDKNFSNALDKTFEIQEHINLIDKLIYEIVALSMIKENSRETRERRAQSDY